MNPVAWWKRWRVQRRDAKSRAQAPGAPLREFVYLDEVSLRSLLSSQTGAMTEGVSEQVEKAFVAELGAKVGADAAIAKSELTSRFQTSNSSTLQTSRKATVQSWFREFHNLANLRLIEPLSDVEPVSDEHDLVNAAPPSIAIPASGLKRGHLAEFRVTLSADPVFHLGTMVSEFSGMAADVPDLFAASDAGATLKQIEPMNRLLQRLLAGLIPVRGRAVDHVVATIEETEYVVHRDAIAGLDLATRPLEIVGVTEHLAYWKDIRRVLFSNAEFTVLCRVSRPGLHASWTPVKLADLFRDLTPDLVDQINAAGRLPFLAVAEPVVLNEDTARMAETLKVYADAYVSEANANLDDEQIAALTNDIAAGQHRFGSPSEQRSAFALVGRRLSELTGVTLEGDRDHALRAQARETTGLALLPTLARGAPAPATAVPVPEVGARMLDVEVIAVYW